MALTLRSNGPAGGLVSSDWWNEYYDLFTGAMSDQPVEINNGLSLKGLSTSLLTAPTLALQAGSGLGTGVYTYGIVFNIGSFAHNMQLTALGPTASITTTAGNNQIVLSSIPVGPAGTSERWIYRTAVGGSSFFWVSNIADNTTTTFTDSVPDGSMGDPAPAHSTFGGSIQLLDQSNNVQFVVYNDGAFYAAGQFFADNGAFYSNGSGGINATGITVSGLSTFNGSIQANSGITVNGTSFLASAQLYGALTMESGQVINANTVNASLVSLTGSPITVNGTSGGTAKLYTAFVGSMKSYYLYFSAYENTTGTEQKITLPQAFSTRAGFNSYGGTPPIHFYQSGSQLSGKCAITTSLPTGSGAGNVSTQSTVNGYSYGEITSGFDEIGLSVSNSFSLTGGVYFVGV